MTVPAIATSVMADVGYTSAILIRTTYDLSVIHRAPLDPDDHDDCILLLAMAFGGAALKAVGGIGAAFGPGILAFNLRRALRAGLRQGLTRAAAKVGGQQLARKLTERALVRVGLVGVNVPIGIVANRMFVRQILRQANNNVRKRGAVVRPLVGFCKNESNVDRTVIVRAVIGIVESPWIESAADDEVRWSTDQLNVLRYCQTLLRLSDEEIAQIEERFDRTITSLLDGLVVQSHEGRANLIELLTVSAAMAPDDRHDNDYCDAIARVTEKIGAQFDRSSVARIRKFYSS